MDIRNRLALVTGGAHRVGKAIALALARSGAHIVVHYGQSHDAAIETVDEIGMLGVEALPVQADLADPAQIEAMFATIEQTFGRLDILVNSASNFMKQPFDEIAPDDWQKAMQVNLQAPFLCIQRAARLMRHDERPPGETAAIINIADLAGVYPWRSYVQHGVSKAGLIHLTKVSANELAPAIRVNAIVPGPILPPAWMDPNSEQWRRITEATPLRRPGDPVFIGQAVVFLAESEYITGAVLPVDGGEHLVGPSSK